MWKTYKKFFQFLLRYRRVFVLFILLLTVLGIINAITPYFYKLFVEALPEKNYQAILNLLALYVGVNVVETVLDVVVYFLGDVVIFKAARDSREALFKKIQDLDFAYHLTKSSGSLISVLKRGDIAYFGMFHELNVLYRILIHLIVMLTMFGSINPQIAWLMGASFVVSTIASKYLLEHNFRTRKAFNKKEDNISGIIVDNLINYETVKYFGKEAKEQSRLSRAFTPWMSTLWKYANSFRLIDAVIGLISAVGLGAVLYFSLTLYMQDLIQFSDFILILGFVTSFYYRFFEAIFRMRVVIKNYSDLTDYFEILNLETKVKDPVEAVTIKRVKGEIEFSKVTFSYKDGKQDALKDFSLRIRAGQSVAFVGKSGVGKTTVVKLLLRFFDVTKGLITIDGVDIRQLAKHELRSHLGVVPQEPVMFNNTISYNIGYGANRTTQREIEAAAKMAHLHEFISELPKGYKTNVGERGVKLSGGQKQRLAIARMILSDPDVVIFDEATSQLDSESEKYIQSAFWEASKDKTTIIIAHRLSTVVRADKIVVLDEGGIAEIGSHRELINKKDGLYRKYWELQVEEI